MAYRGPGFGLSLGANLADIPDKPLARLNLGVSGGGGSANIEAVDDIVALRASTWTTRPDTVVLNANHVSGDGGGIFRWEALSTVADDGALVIKETATTTGRWLRNWSGIADARWWNVRGDGASDDTAALSAAIANTAVNVLLLPGNGADIRITTVTINRDNITIIGERRGTQVTSTNATADIFVIGDGVNIRDSVNLLGFVIWSSVAKTAGSAVRAYLLTNSEFDIDVGTRDLYFANGGVHRLANGVYFDRFAQCSFDGEIVCQFRALAMRGNSDQSVGAELAIGAKRAVSIFRTTVPAVRIGGGAGGIYFDRVDISECAGGILIDNGLTAATYNREVFIGEQTTIDNCTSWAVDVADNGCETLDLNCWISGCGDNGLGVGGVRIQPTTGVVVSIKAASLRIQSCLYDGLQMSAGAIVWNGGFCRSNGIGANGGHGILLGNTNTIRATIVGCIIHDNGNSTRGNGIDIGAACDNFTIEANDLFSNGQVGINNAAGYGTTKLVSNNRGWVTSNSGQANITSGNSTVTVPHGCNAVPNYPVLTNIGHGTTGVQVQALTATDFQIAIPGAAGGTLSFQWYIGA